MLTTLSLAKTPIDRLITTKMFFQLYEFEDQLNSMEDLFPRVKYWEHNLLHQFMDLDRRLHNFVLEFHKKPPREWKATLFVNF
ncbi:hypothetical protein O6P43_006128 [Quillaja saponaria]|uniref:Uncharacterized protein n=1 Tax=Quillaja saponaria TaxID=32244 RepID=A0AAD7Q7K5_QUISA|nr:hypothetical protein O6P43_006128 [Quillaja saponaria]